MLAAPGLIVKTADRPRDPQRRLDADGPAAAGLAVPRLLGGDRGLRDRAAAPAQAARERQRHALPDARAALPGAARPARDRLRLRTNARVHAPGRSSAAPSRAASPRPRTGRRRAGGRSRRCRPRRAPARRSSARETRAPGSCFAATAQTPSSRRTASARYGGFSVDLDRLRQGRQRRRPGTSSSTMSVPSGSAAKCTSSTGSSARALATTSHRRARGTPWTADLAERRRVPELVRRRRQEAVREAVHEPRQP